jgi:hypothetical protein
MSSAELFGPALHRYLGSSAFSMMVVTKVVGLIGFASDTHQRAARAPNSP